VPVKPQFEPMEEDHHEEGAPAKKVKLEAAEPAIDPGSSMVSVKMEADDDDDDLEFEDVM
jgi:hypothetical protein